jgi:hypothetical protein
MLLVRLSRNKVMHEIHAQLLRRTTLLRSLITADFDYCNLLDDHSRIIDLLQKGRVKQALELIDAHYRAVVRSYIMDQTAFPEIPLREALSPAVAADEAAERAPEGPARKPAATVHPRAAKAGRTSDAAATKIRRVAGGRR